MEIRTNSNKWIYWLNLVFLLVAAVFLFACSPSLAPTAVPAEVCPTSVPAEPVSFNQLWEASPHANAQTEAFRHWDATDPQEIPDTCAKCHSRPGFLDFLGVDGTTPGTVDSPAKTGTTITCYVCHNEATYILDHVTFPSGALVSGLGREALCINCHEGRASTQTVNIAIRKAALATDDTPSPDLAFINSHSTSAATEFGSEVQGAYEYDGKTYHGRFTRGTDFFACTRCHDQHSLVVKVETCGACHTFDGEDPRNIRVNTDDFDGDGNIVEGIAYEIDALHTDLYQAIQSYATNVVGVPIVYDAATHPYFFIDTNGNGLAETEEVTQANVYNQFTPRLLRAAYNYNYVSHDPGAYAHNSTYTIQVLYDSLADIGGDVTGKMRP